MNRDILEKLPALKPLEFFSIEAELHYSKSARCTTLPCMSEWLAEESFAEIAACWNETGLFIDVFVNKPFEEACYPRFAEGDAVELFFDTRDLKTAGFATRFCHQFVFLPQPVLGIQAQEITHFRT